MVGPSQKRYGMCFCDRAEECVLAFALKRSVLVFCRGEKILDVMYRIVPQGYGIRLLNARQNSTLRTHVMVLDRSTCPWGWWYGLHNKISRNQLPQKHYILGSHATPLNVWTQLAGFRTDPQSSAGGVIFRQRDLWDTEIYPACWVASGGQFGGGLHCRLLRLRAWERKTWDVATMRRRTTITYPFLRRYSLSAAIWGHR